WDLGGTLVDTYPDVDRTLATAVHASPDAEDIAEVAQLTRRSSSLAISTLAERHGVPEQRLRAAYDALKDRWARQPPPAMEGARQVLGTVRAGGRSNLVSTNRDRQSATVLLEALGLEIEIDDMVCARTASPANRTRPWSGCCWSAAAWHRSSAWPWGTGRPMSKRLRASGCRGRCSSPRESPC